MTEFLTGRGRLMLVVDFSVIRLLPVSSNVSGLVQTVTNFIYYLCIRRSETKAF